MLIQTRHFGEIEVDETRIIEFPAGLPGFADTRRYVLLPHGDDSPFYFLQSLERSEVAFVVTWPQRFFPDYQPVIPPDELEEIGLTAGDGEVEVLVILTVPADPRLMTANLLAPVVINVAARRARQVILNGSGYTTRHCVFPESAATAETVAVGSPARAGEVRACVGG
ncbi:MAG: flagellar assembly protein FliW [Firmicutes bacterium]|nr:flagellar assembly protein FliW [Bacillota bacterium]